MRIFTTGPMSRCRLWVEGWKKKKCWRSQNTWSVPFVAKCEILGKADVLSDGVMKGESWWKLWQQRVRSVDNNAIGSYYKKRGKNHTWWNVRRLESGFEAVGNKRFSVAKRLGIEQLLSLKT